MGQVTKTHRWMHSVSNSEKLLKCKKKTEWDWFTSLGVLLNINLVIPVLVDNKLGLLWWETCV